MIALFLGQTAEELEEVPGLSAMTKTFATAMEAIEQKAREASAASGVAADEARPAASVAG